jgi:hypothetical protein
VQTLRSDLKVEIERGKALAVRPPGHSRALSEAPGVETQKKAAAIRLYEDFTNILVLGVKTERNESSDKDDTIYQCLYTHQVGSQARSKSIRHRLCYIFLELLYVQGISFQLRLYFDLKDDDWQETVKYTPHELDKEPSEFRERLSFLGDTFTFEKHQMQVFYEQLREHVAGAVEQEANSKDATDVIDLRSDDDLYA